MRFHIYLIGQLGAAYQLSSQLRNFALRTFVSHKHTHLNHTRIYTKHYYIQIYIVLYVDKTNTEDSNRATSVVYAIGSMDCVHFCIIRQLFAVCLYYIDQTRAIYVYIYGMNDIIRSEEAHDRSDLPFAESSRSEYGGDGGDGWLGRRD